MHERATDVFRAVAIGLVMLSGTAVAQRTVRPVEPVSGSGLSLPTVIAPEPVRPVIDPVPPANPLPLPSQAESPVVISPPPVCRIRSDRECFNEASACLTARSIDAYYDVDWRDGSPAVVRAYDDLSEDQEADAQGCATDLYACLSASC